MHVYLIHWNADEAAGYAGVMETLGYEVRYEVPKDMSFMRELRNSVPDAIVIGLDRLPMQGRDVGLGIRQSKTTRHVPLIFAGGAEEKVERVKQNLPDAVYTAWSEIEAALKDAIANPPAHPVKPASVLAGYAGTPLVKKLGIKENSTLALVHAPPEFLSLLGDLPEGVQVREEAGQCDLTIWFVRSLEELQSQIDWMAGLADQGALWIVSPKKRSGYRSDMSQAALRRAASSAGLAEYKTCSIDAHWSGLLFTRRKSYANI